MEVLLDTNILVADFMGRGAYFGLLVGEARTGKLRLVIPQVVLQETAKKYRDRAEEAIAKLAAVTSELDALGISTTHLENLKSDPPRLPDFETLVKKRLAEVNAVVRDHPHLTHDALVGRVLQRRKPFGSKGEGYQDALIWETVLELAVGGQVALITANWRDFAKSSDGRVLHPDLYVDLVDRGLNPESIEIFPSIRSFAETHIEPATQHLLRVKELLRSDDAFRVDVEAAIAEALSSQLPHGTPIDADPFELQPFDEPTIAHLDTHPLKSLAVEDARLLKDEGKVLLVFQVVLEADIDIFIFKAAYYVIDDEESPDIIDPDWNDHYMFGQVHRPMTVLLEAKYDPAERNVSDVRVDQASVEFQRL